MFKNGSNILLYDFHDKILLLVTALFLFYWMDFNSDMSRELISFLF